MITGIAYSILLFAIAFAAGLWLGRFKIKGVSIGVIGVLFMIIFYRSIFKVDVNREAKAIETQNADNENTARRMHCMVTNPGIFGKEVPVVRRLGITDPKVTGKNLSELLFRTKYGVVVTRVVRSGVELVAQVMILIAL